MVVREIAKCFLLLALFFSFVGSISAYEDVIAFDLEVVSGGSRWGGPQTTWVATYSGEKGSKPAQFEITLPHKTIGSCWIVRKPGSDMNQFLQDLSNVLLGTVPETVDPVNDLKLRYRVIGDRMTTNKDGSFTSDGEGDWLVVNVIVEDDAEFFLQINERKGRGEIKMKSLGNGDVMIGELARVWK